MHKYCGLAGMCSSIGQRQNSCATQYGVDTSVICDSAVIGDFERLGGSVAVNTGERIESRRNRAAGLKNREERSCFRGENRDARRAAESQSLDSDGACHKWWCGHAEVRKSTVKWFGDLRRS